MREISCTFIFQMLEACACTGEICLLLSLLQPVRQPPLELLGTFEEL